MNREIKFRGWGIHVKRWIFGDLLHTDKEDGRAIQYYDEEDGWMCDDVNEKTVGQFTGLNDKEGHPIYEGDIIKGPHDYRHVIQYFAPEARFTANLIGFECFDHCGINQKWIDECAKVVIGNIFDTPELLKGGEK
jgi:uncharacterized phage protein (TIGR01671 family)